MGLVLSGILLFSLIALAFALRAGASVEAVREEFRRGLAELENRMVARILAGDALIRAQVEPQPPLYSRKQGVGAALSFGVVEFLTYRVEDYDAPLSCCHHGGGLAEGEQFYLIPLNNAPEEGAVLAVCLDCHRKEKELVPQG